MNVDSRAEKAFHSALSRYNRAARLVELADADFNKNWGIMDGYNRTVLRLARRTVVNEGNEP